MSETSRHRGLLIKLLMGAVAMFAFAIFVIALDARGSVSRSLHCLLSFVYEDVHI